jgi:hypothetical protein
MSSHKIIFTSPHASRQLRLKITLVLLHARPLCLSSHNQHATCNQIHVSYRHNSRPAKTISKAKSRTTTIRQMA